jgi:anti-sigma regulatory factor (Ser/Thr protein kinase)
VFRHEALLYAGVDGFLAGTLPFVRAGLEAGEPTLVIVGAEKIELLRGELGRDARRVAFTDMARAGVNPARLIPAWRDFVVEHGGSGRPVRGVGEPIWAERTPGELVECQRHEALLNLAFADDPPLHLLCPYDVEGLDPLVVEEAHRSHPTVVCGGVRRPSERYRAPEAVAAPWAEPLPEPAGPVRELAFDVDTLGDVRRFAATMAADARLSVVRAGDLVLAVHELVSNSVRHGGGGGVLRAWREGDALVCEVRDGGHIAEPLAGRRRPGTEQVGGHGLWLVNQLCELVQVRSSAAGSAVRVHMRCP